MPESIHRSWVQTVARYTVTRSRLLLTGLALASGLALAAPVHRAFDLLAAFHNLYLGLCLVVGPLAAAQAPRGRWAALAMACLALNLWRIAPIYVPPPASRPVDAVPVRLLLANVHTENRNVDALVDLVNAEQPDVLGLLETDDAWAEALDHLLTAYPHALRHPRSDNFGLCLYSRWPLSEASVRHFATVPYILATVSPDSAAPVRIALVHALPPASAADTEVRNDQMRALAACIGELDGGPPWVLGGDFNMPMWSPHYTPLRTGAGLRDARQGVGVLPTWPTMLWPFMIPLDHCLVQPPIRVAGCQALPLPGSDHRALVVDLRVPATGREE